MDSVNERSTWVSTVAFTNELDVAVTPSAATYSILDLESGTTVKTLRR